MNKSEFIRETSKQMLVAYLIEDRIAWFKDMECFGCSNKDLVESSVSLSEMLWESLKEKGYCDTESGKEEVQSSLVVFPSENKSDELSDDLKKAIVSIFD